MARKLKLLKIKRKLFICCQDRSCKPRIVQIHALLPNWRILLPILEVTAAYWRKFNLQLKNLVALCAGDCTGKTPTIPRDW